MKQARLNSFVGRRCRRWVVVAIASLATFLGGCSSTPKKGKSSNPDPIAAPPPNALQPAGQPFWLNAPNNDRTNPAAPPNSVPSINSGVSAIDSASAADPNATGVLAGRVVDAFNRPAGVAIVQVQLAGGGNTPPRSVETSPQGHFVIHGLQNGQSYRLLAKSKTGMRPMVGEALVRTPDAKILIPVSEDYVSPTPNQQQPENGPPVTPPVAELGQPRAAGEFYPAAPESIAGTDAGMMPKANIPPFGLPETSATAVPKVNAISGPVPDCLVGGGRVLTLRLQDPEGRVWDFSQRQGKLVLLDFWGSWCTPCLRSIPELIRLQSAYRSRGLEVIGIACEKESAVDNVARVQRVRRLMPTINYRILMAGEPSNDPVRSQFRPTAYPHLVLLDSDGTILWRGSGGDSITELEAIIRDRLARQ